MNSETTNFSTNIVPLGTRALRTILDHVEALGDTAETGYLEVKSTLDLKDKRSIAKIAKFLLGVANRSPKEAQKHFKGYAVMVIGADKAHSPGVSHAVEPHEMEGSLRSYLGSEFPTFDIETLPIDGERDVMFIIASPPEDGQPMFPCHRDFHGNDRKDNLTNGAIYVRNLTETRPAKANHILSLIERTRGAGKKPINLEIEFFGAISRIRNTEKLIEQLFTYKHDKFMEDIAQKKAAEGRESENTTGSFIGIRSLAPALTGLGDWPSALEMQYHLTSWLNQQEKFQRVGRNYFLGVALPGIRLRVTSHDRFINQPRLEITFHSCEGFRHRNSKRAKPEHIVPEVMPEHPFGTRAVDYDYDPTPAHYPVHWRNTGQDVQLIVTPDSLHPNTAWVSHKPEVAILARNQDADFISVSWKLTEHGNDDAVQSEMALPTNELLDAIDIFKTDSLP